MGKEGACVLASSTLCLLRKCRSCMRVDYHLLVTLIAPSRRMHICWGRYCGREGGLNDFAPTYEGVHAVALRARRIGGGGTRGGGTPTGWRHTAQSGEPDCQGPEAKPHQRGTPNKASFAVIPSSLNTFTAWRHSVHAVIAREG
jgi:hypothetical protein